MGSISSGQPADGSGGASGASTPQTKSQGQGGQGGVPSSPQNTPSSNWPPPPQQPGEGTPPPDVSPPAVADSWGGLPPPVTGNGPQAPSTNGNPNSQNIGPVPISQPPSHPPYLVSPGDIRIAESAILSSIDEQILAHNNLKDYVTQAASQDIAIDNNTMAILHNTQDNLLLNIGDAITLAGSLVSGLNYAAQNYAHADQASYFPQS